MCVTFLLSLVKSLRSSFTISKQRRLRSWRVDGEDAASEHMLLDRKMKTYLEHREGTKKAMREGRWLKRTLRACLFLGLNTTCQGHIASHHFEEYKKRCKAMTPPIPLDHQCISEAMKMVRWVANKMRQLTLSFLSTKMPTEFTREGIMEVVARHIACDDQIWFEVWVWDSNSRWHSRIVWWSCSLGLKCQIWQVPIRPASTSTMPLFNALKSSSEI